MRRRFLKRWGAIAFLACVMLGTLSFRIYAQDAADHPAAQKTEPGKAAADPSAGNANAGVGEILAKTTEQAAHTAEKFGGKLGLGPDLSFWLSILLNFGGRRGGCLCDSEVEIAAGLSRSHRCHTKRN